MSAFSSCHPAVIFIYFLLVIILAMFSWHPVLLALSLFGAAAFYFTISRGRGFFRESRLYIAIFAVSTLTNPLFSHDGMTPLFFLNGRAVTAEAFFYGMAIGAMLVGVMLWFKACSYALDSEKLLFLFGKAAPGLALVLSMALRFIPLFRRRMKRVKNAQKAMGLYDENSYPDKARSAMRVFSAMVTWSLESAVETGNSMKARGYGLEGRSHFSPFAFHKRDAFMLIAITALAAGFTAAEIFGADFFYYPEMSPLFAGRAPVFACVFFGVLCFLPVFTEIKEILKWSYFKSGI